MSNHDTEKPRKRKMKTTKSIRPKWRKMKSFKQRAIKCKFRHVLFSVLSSWASFVKLHSQMSILLKAFEKLLNQHVKTLGPEGESFRSAEEFTAVLRSLDNEVGLCGFILMS